jgi:hypothetical protein
MPDDREFNTKDKGCASFSATTASLTRALGILPAVPQKPKASSAVLQQRKAKRTNSLYEDFNSPFRLAIDESTIRLAYKKNSAVVETTVDVSRLKTSRPPAISAPGFVYDLNRFRKICQASEEVSEIPFHYTPPENLLEIQSGSTTLRVTALPDTEFLEDPIRAEDPSQGTSVNGRLLDAGFRYARLFGRRRRSLSREPILEVRDAYVLVANKEAIGIFNASDLTGINMRIGAESIAAFDRVLPRLDPTAQLFERAEQYLIRDERTALRWPRTGKPLPQLGRLLDLKSDGRFRISRSNLRGGLLSLSPILLYEPSGLLYMRFVGGESPKLTLKVRNASGKSRGMCEVGGCYCPPSKEEMDNPPLDFSISVHFEMLLRVLRHFCTADVEIWWTPDRSLLVIEDVGVVESDENSKPSEFQARTFLAANSTLGPSRS